MSGRAFLERLLNGNDAVWMPMGKFGEFTRGSGLQKKDFVESGFPVIHYGQIHTKYDLSAEKTVSFVPVALAGRLKKARQNDLLLATTSEDDEAVGKPLAWLGGDIAISGDMMIFRHTQNVRYLAHFVRTAAFQSQKTKYITGAKVRRISSDDLAKIRVPIPCPDTPEKSLAIQAEIVRILDSFTELTAELIAELIAELTARRKQYDYYRDRLLRFEDREMEWKTLGEVTTSIASGRNKIRINDGAIPVYGSTGVIGFTHEVAYTGDALLVARVGANAGLINAVSGDFDVSDNTLIVRDTLNKSVD